MKAHRKRVNICMLCSSNNYEESHKAHLNMINREHKNFVDSGYNTGREIYYMRCRGQLIQIPDDKVQSFKDCNIPMICKII